MCLVAAGLLDVGQRLPSSAYMLHVRFQRHENAAKQLWSLLVLQPVLRQLRMTQHVCADVQV